MKGSATPLPSGLAHEEGRCFDPQAFDFVLEIAGHVVRAMIVTQLQSTRHTGSDGSKAPILPLTHRNADVNDTTAGGFSAAGCVLSYLIKVCRT